VSLIYIGKCSIFFSTTSSPPPSPPPPRKREKREEGVLRERERRSDLSIEG